MSKAEAGSAPGAGSILVRKMRTATRQPLTVFALLPVAWTLIGLASATIALVPFRRLSTVFGRNVGTAASIPIVTPRARRRAERIGQAITIAAKYAPFRSNCLPQALVAVRLCRIARVPCAAFLGATMTDPKKPGEMSAHAWVQAGPVMLTGGAGSFHRFGTLACFLPRAIPV